VGGPHLEIRPHAPEGQDGGVNPPDAVLIVDMANVVGSRPDGWWRDRAGAATRLLERLDRLAGQVVSGPTGEAQRLAEVVAVLEGRATRAVDPERVRVVRAAADGDTEVVAQARAAVTGSPRPVLVVTADRGLRGRLPADVLTAGPGWLRALLPG
jgi:hypothetical protein